eukprot:scaffold22485_cov70-Phaeocystis_antarctica.AAC.3
MSPLPTQVSSSGAAGAVARSAAGMSVSARARARSAAHSRPNLTTGRRRKYIISGGAAGEPGDPGRA